MKLALLVLLVPVLAFGGSIPRSQAARHEFVRIHACPGTGKNRLPCPGYIIDHKKALACGGADAPSNMQWQTVAAAHAKDRVELKGCVINGRVHQ